MELYRFPGGKSAKAALGLLFLGLLLLCRDTLMTSCVLGFGQSQLLMLGLMALTGLAFLLHNRREWKKLLGDRRMGCVLVCAAVLLLPMAVKRDWQMMYFSILLCPVFAVFLSYFLTGRQAAKIFVLLMTALGIYSLMATYLLRQLPDRGILDVPVFYNSAGVDFYNFGLGYVSLDYCKNRNFGIFREPGAYQFFLMLALFLNNYWVDWETESRMWILNAILAAVMLSTLAIGGYLELGLFALVLFFDKKLYRNKAVVIAAVVLVLGAAALVLWAYRQQNMLWWEIYAMTISKFSPEESSGADRIRSLIVNLNFFLHSPLVGARLGEVLHAMENNTSSTMLMLAIFGLPGGLLHLAGWTALVWKTGRKLWVKLALLLVLLMAFNTQNLIADVFLWMMPTMALTEAVGSWKGRKKA